MTSLAVGHASVTYLIEKVLRKRGFMMRSSVVRGMKCAYEVYKPCV